MAFSALAAAWTTSLTGRTIALDGELFKLHGHGLDSLDVAHLKLPNLSLKVIPLGQPAWAASLRQLRAPEDPGCSL